MFVRRLVQIPQQTSFFLFGPRQTGKSTLLRETLKDQAAWQVSLLNTKDFLRFQKDPSLFANEARFQIEKKGVKTVVVDEIQKVPALLDEIHLLIELTRCQFILSGSSARKIKRSHANLLGGRSLLIRLFPLLFAELREDFDLERVLRLGSLAGIYFDTETTARKKLRAYVDTYLKEEIAHEGVVRNIGTFQRFLEVAGQYGGESLNFENISRESSVPAKTVRGYFDILEDTLIGFYLPAWDRSLKKQLAKHSKFYFFDNGVQNALTQSLSSELSPDRRGRLFEQWMINEIRAQASYRDWEGKFHYWRTQAGNEVDLLLSQGNQIKAAIEFKAIKQVSPKHLSGLRSLLEDAPEIPHAICVAEVPAPLLIGKIQVLPWKYFLEETLNEILS